MSGGKGAPTLAIELDAMKRAAAERERQETARKFDDTEADIHDIRTRLFPDVFGKIDELKERLIRAETRIEDQPGGATRNDKLQLAAGGTGVFVLIEFLQSLITSGG